MEQQIVVLLSILGVTVLLLVLEAVRIDLVAMLFMPALLSTSRRKEILASDLNMPVGCNAISGGLLSMIGCSSLITMNDLLPDAGLAPLGLLAAISIGLLRILAGTANEHCSVGRKLLDDLPATIGLPCRVALIGKSLCECGSCRHRHCNVLPWLHANCRYRYMRGINHVAQALFYTQDRAQFLHARWGRELRYH